MFKSDLSSSGSGVFKASNMQFTIIVVKIKYSKGYERNEEERHQISFGIIENVVISSRFHDNEALDVNSLFSRLLMWILPKKFLQVLL